MYIQAAEGVYIEATHLRYVVQPEENETSQFKKPIPPRGASAEDGRYQVKI